MNAWKPKNHSIADEATAPLLGDVLDEITELLERYISLPDPALAMLVACWIANTYTYQHFQYCGYLALRSATPRCGKSRLLRLIGGLAKGAPKPTAFPTAAVLFRSQHDVLLLDEVDALGNRDKRTHSDLLVILNAGFERGGTVERLEKRQSAKRESFEPVSFDIYGPKALAGIESLADTLADRAFHIQMQRSVEKMPRLIERESEETFKEIREGLQEWAGVHGDDVECAYAALPVVPDLADMDDRFQDISEPLVVLASLADEERPAGELILPRLYAGLRFAAGRREPSGRERSLVAVMEIAERLLGSQTKLFIPTEVLLGACQEHPDLEYLEHGQGLAGLLKHMDLKPHPTGKIRGYTITKKWLTDWQSRYHPRTDGLDGLDGKLGTREGTSSLLPPSSTTSTTTPLSKKVSKLSGVSGSEYEIDLQEPNSHQPVKKWKGARGTQRKRRDTTGW